MNSSLFGIIAIIFGICGLIFIFSKADKKLSQETTNILQEALEQAYFEGQKDALEGDIRIKLVSDSTYVWIKSPWNKLN